MALDDTAVLIPGTGYGFINPTVGATPPATTTSAIAALDLTAATLATGWTNIGHTAREDNVSLSREGGDVTVQGSWQSSALRSVTAPIIYTIALNALQIDNEVFKMYFGGGVATGTDRFDLPDSPTPVDRALFVVMVDGTTRLPLYVPKASIIGSDAVEVDAEDFLQFSLSATVLKNTGSPLASFFHPNLGV
jgi:hypothetical protein